LKYIQDEIFLTVSSAQAIGDRMKIAFIIAIIIVIAVLGWLAYFGAFTKVGVVEKQLGPLWLAYEKHIGDYKKVAQIMDKMYRDLKKSGVETTRGFGMYFDNPRKVEKDKLRSVVGCILDNVDSTTIESLKVKFRLKPYPQSKCVVSQFPFKGKPSIIMGIFKVYPKLSKHLKKQSQREIPIMEIYDVPGKTISYVASFYLTQDFYNQLLE
jgi:hypothetical protein